MKERRIIVGITGATRVVYGIRMLEQLRASRGVETHLAVSRSGHLTRAYETDMSANELIALADHHHNFNDLAAPIASGSFVCDGMVVALCSVKTLSEIAYCNSSSVLTRSADVMLKERKPLVVMVRETPLHAGDLECMIRTTQKRCHHRTPVTSFYVRPQSIDDLVDHTVARVLDLLDIHPDIPRWKSQATKLSQVVHSPDFCFVRGTSEPLCTTGPTYSWTASRRSRAAAIFLHDGS